jgi:tripartite-type tricarboxylate transporter receptor subunit TctC
MGADHNFIRDIAPVAGIVRVPNIMLVNQSLPIKTIPELIAYAEANPGKTSMASAGIGSTGHLAGELMKMTAGIDFVHVPYRGNAPAMTDLLSGQVQILFASLPSSIEYVRAGKARGLAVTTAARTATAPDLPAIAEFVSGYEVSSWYGIGAPRNTPAGVVDALNEAVNAGLADPKLKKQLEDQGGIEMAGTPADFGKLIAEETEKWAKVIKFAGIKPQ